MKVETAVQLLSNIWYNLELTSWTGFS